MPPLDDVGAVVVHHRHYSTIGTVVSALVAEGVPLDNIVVVDNSEEAGSSDRVASICPPGTRIVVVSNHGYGAAVNRGVAALRPLQSEFILVATHEVRIGPSAVSALREALKGAPRAAAAGPTLTIGDRNQLLVWSTGGGVSRIRGLPQHFDHRTSLATVRGAGVTTPQEREWLDGAFVLYRAALLDEYKVNETFFMYVEEVDLHLRFRAAGHQILWVPSAEVCQDTAGTPSYYAGRNLILLQRLRRNTAGVPLIILTVILTAVRASLRTRRVAPIASTIRGIVNGLTTRLAR
jgi:GT2 family glycosyltransferase